MSPLSPNLFFRWRNLSITKPSSSYRLICTIHHFHHRKNHQNPRCDTIRRKRRSLSVKEWRPNRGNYIAVPCQAVICTLARLTTSVPKKLYYCTGRGGGWESSRRTEKICRLSEDFSYSTGSFVFRHILRFSKGSSRFHQTPRVSGRPFVIRKVLSVSEDISHYRKPIVFREAVRRPGSPSCS